jgi:type II secretory pathway pseudopilin PulG
VKIPLHSLKKTRLASYILLEVMLATGIFALAGVSLAVTMGETISAGSRLQRETHVIWNLESRLNEVRLKTLVVGKEKMEPDAAGVTYEEETTLLELKNEKNISLNGLYNVKVTARWKEQNRPTDMVAQIYVYQP